MRSLHVSFPPAGSPKLADRTARHVETAGSAITPSRPADIQSVDFLIAGIAGENRRAVGRDIDLSISVIQHTMKVFQAGDGFAPLVGKPDALHLWIRTSGRKAEILAVRRY